MAASQAAAHDDPARRDVVYRFGPFRLDPAGGVLWRDGSAASLTPKAHAVLEHLVARAGRLVSKDELLDAVWSGVFVGDGVLKVCIREIRRVLDDDSKAPIYVETAHRRGYRFAAPVIVEPRGPEPPDARGTVATFVDEPPLGHTDPPHVQYARSGDINIAYQVIGDGPIDLVFVMGWVSHLEYFWKAPSFARFLRRLSSFSRLILFDKRGTGLSDRVGELPTLEERMDDVRAVMEAVGSRRAALLGVSEGGPMCSLFAASYPEKTEALIMIGTYAKRLRDPEYPWAPTRDARELFLREILDHWGGPVGIEERAPSVAHDPAFRDWWAAYLRMGASPGAAVALTRMNAEIDVRHVLRSIRVPTLVLHRTGDRCLRVEEGRFVASQIPGSRFLELPGDDHLPFVGDQEDILAPIEGFLRDTRESLGPDFVLATVLVGLFDEASADEGAAPARDRFASHLRKEVDWFRGRLHTLDEAGFLATYDGPARAIRCAGALTAAADRLGARIRVGLHTGECDLSDRGVAGPAVERGKAVARLAPLGAVLVSRTVRDLVAGAGFTFATRGVHVFDQAEGERELYAIERS